MIQDNVVRGSVEYFDEFRTEAAARIYSVQKVCLFEDNFYGDTEIIMSLKEWKDYWIQFEKDY